MIGLVQRGSAHRNQRAHPVSGVPISVSGSGSCSRPFHLFNQGPDFRGGRGVNVLGQFELSQVPGHRTASPARHQIWAYDAYMARLK